MRAARGPAARPARGAHRGAGVSGANSDRAARAAALGDVASHTETGTKFGMGEGGVSSPRRHGEGPRAREHAGKKSWKSAPRAGEEGLGWAGLGGGGWGGVSGAGEPRPGGMGFGFRFGIAAGEEKCHFIVTLRDSAKISVT